MTMKVLAILIAVGAVILVIYLLYLFFSRGYQKWSAKDISKDIKGRRWAKKELERMKKEDER